MIFVYVYEEEKMKKVIALLLMIVMTFSLSVSAFAAEEKDNMNSDVETSTTVEFGAITIDLNDCVRIEVDDEGNIIGNARVAMGEHDISAGATMWYYRPDNSKFSINRGTTVSFKATFDKSVSYECGYSGAGYTTAMASGKGRSFSKSAKMPADGNYSFYIKNTTSEKIHVTNGSITY